MELNHDKKLQEANISKNVITWDKMKCSVLNFKEADTDKIN